MYLSIALRPRGCFTKRATSWPPRRKALQAPGFATAWNRPRRQATPAGSRGCQVDRRCSRPRGDGRTRAARSVGMRAARGDGSRVPGDARDPGGRVDLQAPVRGTCPAASAARYVRLSIGERPRSCFTKRAMSWPPTAETPAQRCLAPRHSSRHGPLLGLLRLDSAIRTPRHERSALPPLGPADDAEDEKAPARGPGPFVDRRRCPCTRGDGAGARGCAGRCASLRGDVFSWRTASRITRGDGDPRRLRGDCVRRRVRRAMYLSIAFGAAGCFTKAATSRPSTATRLHRATIRSRTNTATRAAARHQTHSGATTRTALSPPPPPCPPVEGAAASRAGAPGNACSRARQRTMRSRCVATIGAPSTA